MQWSYFYYTLSKSVFLDTVQYGKLRTFLLLLKCLMKGSEIEDEELLQEIKNVPLAARISTLALPRPLRQQHEIDPQFVHAIPWPYLWVSFFVRMWRGPDVTSSISESLAPKPRSQRCSSFMRNWIPECDMYKAHLESYPHMFLEYSMASIYNWGPRNNEGLEICPTSFKLSPGKVAYEHWCILACGSAGRHEWNCCNPPVCYVSGCGISWNWCLLVL